jgi:hypothetical protein
MTDAMRRWPRSLRAGAVVTLLLAVAALLTVQWVRDGTRARENERLYEQCLSTAQDVAQVKGCTADFYARWDGRLGEPDPFQVAAESRRLVELRTTAVDLTSPAAVVPAPAGEPPSPTEVPTASAPSQPVPVDVVDEAEPPREPAPATRGTDTTGTAPSTDPVEHRPSTRPTPTTPPQRSETAQVPDPVPAAEDGARPDPTVAVTSRRPSTASPDVPDPQD